MSQPNRKYKRLEALLSETEPVQPEPENAPGSQEVDKLKAQVSELEKKLAQQPSVAAQEITIAGRKPASRPPRQESIRGVFGTQEQSQMTSQKRFALRNAVLAVIGSALADILYLFLVLQNPAWQLTAAFIDTLLLLIASMASLYLIRRGNLTRGMWVQIGAMQFVFFVGAALFTDLGVVFGLGLIALALVMAIPTLPPRQSTLAIVTAVIVGTLCVLLDVFAPAFRMPVPASVRIVIPGIIGVIILIFGYFLTQYFKFLSLRLKAFTAFAVVSLISVGALSITTNAITRADLTRNVGTNLKGVADTQAYTIGDQLLAEADILSALGLSKTVTDKVKLSNSEYDVADPNMVDEILQLDQQWRAADTANNDSDPLVQSRLNSLLASELRTFRSVASQHVEVFVTDRWGALIAATNRTSDYFQADEDWWKAAFNNGQGAIYIGQPALDESSGTVSCNIAVPLYDPDTRAVIGVLRSTLNTQALASSLGLAKFGQTGEARLWLPSGEMLNSANNIEAIDASTLNQLHTLEGIDYAELVIDGESTLLSQADVASRKSEGSEVVKSLGWKVISRQDTAEALQIVEASVRTSLLAGLGALLLAGLIAFFVVRTLVSPIVRLTATAEKIQAGDLNAQAPVETRDEIGSLASTFNSMTAQLSDSIDTLERRVAERTHDLQLASEVGRAVSEKTADIYGLLKDAVELIRNQFNLYYTQIYIADPAGRTLTLSAGTGEVGAELLHRGHHLSIGAGSLNGQAASEKRAVIVADTKDSPSFLPNPLLPETRSEMAIPLIASARVVGVLDMQSEQPGALNETNLPAFEALAGQLAVAIQNASLLAESKEARSDLEAQMRSMAERGWHDFMDAIEQGQKIGFAFDQNNVVSLDTHSLSPAGPNAVFTAPITVTGSQIGTIQLVDEPERAWSSKETQLVQSTAAQLAQHIDNLRLLAQAQRYRTEAEQAARRLTREGWEDYLQSRAELAPGYVYDLNKVQLLSENGSSSSALKKPLVVRDETIGELAADSAIDSQEAAEVILAVSQQLSSHLENLRLTEQNEERAHELQTVAEVTATTSTTLEPDNLLQAVVDLTKERFGVYHAHIYLADDAWRTLLLASGAGEVGRKMVAEQHAIPFDAEKSLVARAARERQAAIVNDVRNDPGFLPNPMLPETRSEMAVPMIVGDRLLGVFDVQADTVNYFSDEDAQIYTTLASQVAVALQNARLYTEQAATVAQLREFDRLKTSFLANMSHELRTPLNSILGFTDVILEELDGPLTEPMDNDLKLIQKNGQHLLHLINDVLDMAKIEAGRMNLAPERFKIHDMFEEVVNITSPLATEKALPLFVEDDSDQEVEIFADRTRIRQVMLNLLNNALKFTEKGQISLRALRQGEKVLISVRDTGAGIPTDQLETVFQEFTQLDTSTTRKTGGTGLGLPISRRLVEMHGGRMRAESTGVPGEGSTLYVELPIEAQITEAIEKQEK